MMSYQANFASHPTATAMLISFCMAGLDTTKCLITFYLVHITIPNYDRVAIIVKHTVEISNLAIKHISKVTAGFVVFLHTAPYKKETKERGKVMRVSTCLRRRANPL